MNTDVVDSFINWQRKQKENENDKLRHLPPEMGSSIAKTPRQTLFNRFVKGPITNNIESFNHFISIVMPLQIEMKPMHDELKNEYFFKDVRVLKPMMPDRVTPMFPHTARSLGLTYYGEIRANFYRRTAVGDVMVAENVSLDGIPIMLGSQWCHLAGYTPEECRAVLEDPDDPLGYYIIKGGERVLISQDKLATAQQLTTEQDKRVFATRVTIPNINGTTVLMLTLGKAWPSIKFILCQSGMKSSVSRKFPIFAVFDVIFQRENPREYGYERISGVSSVRIPVEVADDGSEVENRREKILSRAISEIMIFIPYEFRDRARMFFTASIAKYRTIKDPTMHIVKKRTKSTTVQAAAAQAAASAPKRRATAAVMATTEGATIPSTPSTILNSDFNRSVREIIEKTYPRGKKIDEKTTEFVSRVFKIANELVKSMISRHGRVQKTLKTRIVKKIDEYDDKPDDLPPSVTLAAAIATAAEQFVATTAESDRREEASAAAAAEADESFEEAESEIDHIVNEILNDMFVNVPRLSEKSIHLARLVAQQVMSCIGARAPDNRDGWENKRIEVSAGSLSQLFSGIFRGSVSSKGQYTPGTNLLDEFISSFGPKAAWGGRDNISEMVRRDTPVATISQIGRINTPASRQSKQQAMRMLQASQVGYCCVGETPEGASCGLTKGMCCTMINSLRRDTSAYIQDVIEPVVREVYGLPLDRMTYDEFQRPHPILVNNKIVGWCNAAVLDRPLRNETKRNWDFYDVSVSMNPVDRTLEIYTTGSRPCRPLFTVDEERGGLSIDFIEGAPEIEATLSIRELVERGLVQFISAREQFLLRVVEYSTKVEVDRVLAARAEARRANPDVKLLDLYCEIDPVSILSSATGLMPVANRNQGPRITYQASMIKQALGLYHDSYYARMSDASFKRFDMPSIPTFDTRIAESYGVTRCPTGKMFILAFYTLANNIEDGLVMKRESFEKMTISKYSVHKTIVRTQLDAQALLSVGVPVETIEKPEEALGASAGSIYSSIYKTIEANGLPKIGTKITKGSCILGRIRTILGANGSITRINASVFASVGDDGIVDRITISKLRDGKTDVRIRIRQIRNIIPGDKFASRYSQKGTIGAFRSQTGGLGMPSSGTTPNTTGEAFESLVGLRFAEELPRIASGPFAGCVPDIWINPASIPTRMTVGKMDETLASKEAIITGVRKDATTFGDLTREYIERFGTTLEQFGLERYGTEEMVHADGTPIKTRVFVGPCYYQILRHNVLDKIQYRSKGNVSQVTLQPVHGRNVEGGLRNGEMERSALISWGAAHLVRERMMLSSDKYNLAVCATCGKQAIINPRISYKHCQVCDDQSKANIGIVTCSFISVLIFKILEGMGIFTTFNLASSEQTLD